jgi:hypothetical protein
VRVLAAAAVLLVLPSTTLGQRAAATRASAVPKPPSYVSCGDHSTGAERARTGVVKRHAVAKPAVSEAQARGEIEEAVARWEEEARSFRGEVQGIVQKQFDERRRFLAENYE